MKVRRVRVGDVLTLERWPIEISPETAYRRIGIYSWGKGFLHRPEVSGAEIGSLKYFTFPKPSLVMSNIQAWEGAVALASELEDGHVASNRFLPYVPIRTDEVDLKFIFHYFMSDDGMSALRRASPGTQVRNRTLGRRLFEDLAIPLPDIAEQRRIAAHLESVQSIVASISDGRRARIRGNVQCTIATALVELSRVSPLAEIAEINPRPTRVTADALVGFVPMAALSAETGAIVELEERRRDSLTSGHRQFTNGDLIFARITPCMQNGKTAVYRSESLPVAYGSTEFHVIRTDAALARWLHAVMRTRWFIDQAAQAFTGTAGQQRVPAQFLKDFRVPLPADLEEATKRLLHLTAQESTAIGLIERAHINDAALLPAARNQVFNSLR